MDSGLRDSKVNPIGELLEAETEKFRTYSGELESLLVAGDRACKEELKLKRKKKRKVQWNDINGNSLVEIREYLPSDEDESNPCFCTIM
ncbi:hypothetical protein V2J09_023106 [Rumex salicifolius]